MVRALRNVPKSSTKRHSVRLVSELCNCLSVSYPQQRQERAARRKEPTRRTRVARALLFSANRQKSIGVDVSLTRSGNRRGTEGGYVFVEEYLRGHTIRNTEVSVRDAGGIIHEFRVWWQQPLNANGADRSIVSVARMPRNKAIASLVADTLFKGDLLVMKEGKRQKYVHISSRADRLLAYKAVIWYVPCIHMPRFDKSLTNVSS